MIGPYEVDLCWPRHRVVAELDGWETHGTRTAFERDRARDQWLAARGYRVVRFSFRQLKTDPAGVIATLRSLLEGL